MASSAKSSSLNPADSAALLDRFRATGQNAALIEFVRAGVQKKARTRRKIAKTTAAAAAAILFLVWAIPTIRSTASLETLPTHRQQFTLADGSQTELNARTEMKTDFRYGRRLVHLSQGEAYFSVVKDPQHPFFVETPLGTVRVTGTKFNVRLSPDGQAAVTLFEGSVIVTPQDASPAQLTPGNEADLSSGSATVRALSAAQLDAVTAWRHGRLVLDDLTLAEAVRRIADYHGCNITVSPSSAQIRLGGSSSLDDLPQFFDTLKGMGLQVVDRGDGNYQVTGR
jgi:transmembrane sensor